MGCDIHMYAETYNKEKKVWEKVGDIFTNPWYTPDKFNNYEWNTEKHDKPYDDRNYNLFAILADVRNGYGFAGIPTGSGFIPISSPRGLPDNVSPQIKKESDSWKHDGFSHSWLTLKELLEYDWEGQSTILYGTLTSKEYRKYKDNNDPPTSYCALASGDKVEIISNEEMDKLIEKYSDDELAEMAKKDDGKYYYTSVQWKVTYKEAAENFFEFIIPELKALGDPEHVRIVFWFDN